MVQRGPFGRPDIAAAGGSTGSPRALFVAGPIRIAKKTIESPVAAALALTAHGIDLVDTLHLTSRPAGAVFVSFDKSSFGARDAGTRGVSAGQVRSSQVKN